MKKTITLLLTATLALPAVAETLTPEQALERALNDLSPARLSAPARTARAAAYELAATEGSLYVFNRADGGYMITTSDSELRPVLAVADSGNFDSETIPPAMKWLLGQYEAEAATAATARTVPDYYVGWEPVAPIVKAKWDQGSPYNDRCPEVYGQKTVTGCAATAMAQIIYTHRYAKGTGRVSYTLWADGSEQTFDFESAEFNFDVMTDTYDSKSSAESCAAVAELMEACGKGAEMSYLPGESTTNVERVQKAIVTYLGYSPYSDLCNRSSYQTDQWETIIYNEVKAGRPVLYSGSTDTGGGHAFVCDGYDGNGMFHINWGWSGMSDGYFSLTSLKPGQVGTGAQPGGFNAVQQIVTFLTPDVEDIPDYMPIDYEGKDVAEIIIDDVDLPVFSSGNDVSVTFTAINKGEYDLQTNSARICLFEEGSDVPTVYGEEVRSYSVPAGDARRSIFPMKLMDDKANNIPAGKYVLKICDTGGTPLSAESEYIVEVTDEDVKDEGFQHWGQISVSDADLSIPAVIFPRRAFKVTPAVRNDASTPVVIGLALFTPGTNNVVWKSTEELTIQVTNGIWIGNFPYLKEYTVRGVDVGTYEAAFITSGDAEISARKVVRLAQRIDGVAYAPLAGGTEAAVVPYNYSGDVVISSEVTFEDGRTMPVTGVDAETFMDNSKVTSVDFPATLKTMGLHSMRYMTAVDSLIFRGETVPFVHIAAVGYRMKPSVKILVPEGSVEAYNQLINPYEAEALNEDSEQGAIVEVNAETSVPAAIYDLQGRRVNSPTRGIYIVGGKKIRL